MEGTLCKRVLIVGILDGAVGIKLSSHVRTTIVPTYFVIKWLFRDVFSTQGNKKLLGPFYSHQVKSFLKMRLVKVLNF